MPKLTSLQAMSAFPEWKKYAVEQKRLQTGCIPTGYEILLRTAGVEGVDFATFQDEFDLDWRGGPTKNNFSSVADAVKAKYPNIEFTQEVFAKGKGNEKLARVEERLKAHQPTLISLARSFRGGWHIMLVVDSDANELTLLNHVDKNGVVHLERSKKVDFVFKHDLWPGGEEIAYLKSF